MRRFNKVQTFVRKEVLQIFVNGFLALDIGGLNILVVTIKDLNDLKDLIISTTMEYLW